MKRGRQHKGKVNVAKRQKQFAAAKPAMAVGYQAGRELAGQPKQELKGFDNALQTLTPNTVLDPNISHTKCNGEWSRDVQ